MSDQRNVEEKIAAVQVAWARIVAWLETNAPDSARTLGPPADAKLMDSVEGDMDYLYGHGLPEELRALWQLCGSVVPVGFDGDEDKDGKLSADRFIDGLVLLAPDRALTAHQWWDQANGDSEHPQGAAEQWLPWLGPDPQTIDYGSYTSEEGIGRWACYEGVELSPPSGSIAMFLEQVAEALQDGTGPLMERTGAGHQVPGKVGGALIWAAPPYAPAVWQPLHR